jgi:hypothetical protein
LAIDRFHFRYHAAQILFAHPGFKSQAAREDFPVLVAGLLRRGDKVGDFLFEIDYALA